jgi:hypothetical protein
MAQISEEHLAPLTVGWVVLLVGSFLLLGVLNHVADK